MDLAALASIVVGSFLVPIAKNMVDKVREKLSTDIGEKTAEQAGTLFKKVWDRVESMFTSDSDKAALSDFQKYPDTDAARLERVLRDKLERDPAAAKELSLLVNQAGAEMAGVSIGQIIANNVGFAHISHSPISGIAGGVVIVGDREVPANNQPPKK
jgi:hypothetical protein